MMHWRGRAQGSLYTREALVRCKVVRFIPFDKLEFVCHSISEVYPMSRITEKYRKIYRPQEETPEKSDDLSGVSFCMQMMSFNLLLGWG